MPRCGCTGCIRHRRFDAMEHLRDHPDDHAFLTEVFETLMCAENDVAYYRAILDGTWPNARHILEGCLAKLPQETGE